MRTEGRSLRAISVALENPENRPSPPPLRRPEILPKRALPSTPKTTAFEGDDGRRAGVVQVAYLLDAAGADPDRSES